MLSDGVCTEQNNSYRNNEPVAKVTRTNKKIQEILNSHRALAATPTLKFLLLDSSVVNPIYMPTAKQQSTFQKRKIKSVVH